VHNGNQILMIAVSKHSFASSVGLKQ